MELNNFFKKIDEKDIDKWIPKARGFYGKLFNQIISSEGTAFEININEIKKKRPRASADSIVSAFYSWRKKKSTRKYLATRNLGVKIVKRTKKIGIIKIPKAEQNEC